MILERQVDAYVCLLVTFFAAAVTLIARLVARRLTKLRLWWDDWFAIITFLFAIVWFGLVIWWIQLGLGLHLRHIPFPNEFALEKSRLILFNIEIIYAFALAFAKLSILAFYWRMFKTSNILLPTKILIGCTIIWLIIRTFMAIFHCVPIQKFWKPELDGVCNIDDSEFFFGTVLTHLLIDIVILALPVIEVQKLHLPLPQRIAIISMFLFGIFVCVASVVVLIYSIRLDTSSIEVPYNISPIIIWATVEINLAIVSACLPMLRPVYLLIRRRPLTKNGSSDPNSGYGQSNSLATSHKLTTLSTTHKELARSPSNSKSATESTHHLAESDREGSISSASDYNPNGASPQPNGHGNNTVIVGSVDQNNEDGPGRRERGQSWSGLGGIMVTNEMSVRVSRVG